MQETNKEYFYFIATKCLNPDWELSFGKTSYSKPYSRKGDAIRMAKNAHHVKELWEVKVVRRELGAPEDVN